MKKFIILLIAVTTVFGATAKPKKPLFPTKKVVVDTVVVALLPPAPVKIFFNDIDTMSYALGVNIATDLSKNLKTLPDGNFNKEIFLKAFNTVMKGDSAIFSNESSQAFLQTYFTKAQAKISNDKKAEGEKFLQENAMNPAVKTTASGLQYIILKDTVGPKPVATDKVKVHYEGTLLNGTKFDSSYDRGEPIDFVLNEVIPGWTEGVMLMSPGSKYKFYVPYNLGYGDQGAGEVIPPFATLIFVVELLEINPVAITDQIKQLEINN